MSECGKHRCKESQKLVLSAHVRCSAALVQRSIPVPGNPGEKIYILHQSQMGSELRSQQRLPRLGMCRNEKAVAAGPQAWDGLVALNTPLLPLYLVGASAVPGGDTNKYSTCDLPRVV